MSLGTDGCGPVSVEDLEAISREKVDSAVWDFVAGGSEDELTLRANREAFAAWRLRPRVLQGISECDLSIELLGTPLSSPFVVAPIGYQGLLHPEGELATAKGAALARSLFVASTMSNSTLEQVAAASPGPRWFQLYVLRDRELTLSLVRRAEDAGYSALVVTVDVPLIGRRERDLRNGFVLPRHLRPGNLPPQADETLHQQFIGHSGLARHAERLFDPHLSWQTIAWLQASTRVPIILKGILTREDAILAADLGVRGLIVSNHGGRQLDGAIASLDALPEVVDAVGKRCEVMLDGGIRRGSDALKARALGARAVLIGRPVVWGLIASGVDGVATVLRMLQRELEHAMLLAGCARWSGVERSLLSAVPIA